MKNAMIPLLMVVFVIVAGYFLVQPTSYLVGAFVIDDGLYYLEVPRNIVSGNGVTYDNRTITNGFHPLWGGICVLVATVAGAESSRLLRGAMFVQAVFVLLSLVFLWQIVRATKMELLGAVLAMAALFFSRLDLYLSTMESSTLLLALTVLVLASVRLELLRSVSPRRNVLLGGLLALVFFARLDTIFIVIAFLLVQAAMGLRGKFGVARLKPTFISGAVFTALTTPYLIVNKVYFGSIVPVSGIKKMSATQSLWHNVSTFFASVFQTVAGKTHIPVFVLVALLVVGSVVLVWSCRHNRVKPNLRQATRGGVLPALVLGVVLRSAYLLAFVEEYTHVPWYWVPEYFAAYLMIAVFVSVVIWFLNWNWLRNTVVLYLIAAVVTVAGCRYLVSDAGRYQEANGILYDTALWAAENVPDGKLLAMIDSGVLAFFSNHDVLPMNGLITDRPTMEMIRAEGISAAMKRFEVDYFVNYVRESIVIPERVVLYQTKAIPNGRYKDYRVALMKFKDYPDETITYGYELNEQAEK